MSAVTLQGQIFVMADLLSEAFDVLATIDAEDSDEGRRIAVLLSSIADALAVVRRPGVDIDAVHFKLT